MSETPKCPYCGDRMHIHVSLITPEWELLSAQYRCVTCESTSPRIEFPGDTANDKIIERLQAVSSHRAEPENRVLTLEEIVKAGVAWLEGKLLPVVPAIVYGEASDDANSYKACIAFTERCGEINDYPVYDYGKRWRCWLRKPTAEETKKTPWKEESHE